MRRAVQGHQGSNRKSSENGGHHHTDPQALNSQNRAGDNRRQPHYGGRQFGATATLGDSHVVAADLGSHPKLSFAFYALQFALPRTNLARCQVGHNLVWCFHRL